ncbi:hypothetical protein DFQ30_009327 [Apophysomyces sp. BC1015]|nr:hypothetical protein DFQ30_009327 [Apophysomyces sp. BC1015]
MAEHLSNTDQLELLRRQGFVVVPGLLNVERCDTVKHTARAELAQLAGPVEFEADLHYPGAPRSHDAPGGRTVRRLLDAYARSALYRQWATSVEIRSWMKLYFGEQYDDQAPSVWQPDRLASRHPVLGVRARGARVGVARTRPGDRGEWLTLFHGDLADAAGGRRSVFPLQYIAFGGEEFDRRRQVFAGLYLSWGQQRAGAGYAFSGEARSAAVSAGCWVVRINGAT